MSFGTGSFNIGTDLSLVITNLSSGAQVTLDGRRTKFTSSAKDKVIEGTAIDNGGLVDHRVEPGGWTGSLEVERANDNFSALVSMLDAAFYAGAAQTFFTIESYEPTSDKTAMAVYQFTRVVFHGYKPGDWTRSSAVRPSVSFEAQERKKVQ